MRANKKPLFYYKQVPARRYATLAAVPPQPAVAPAPVVSRSYFSKPFVASILLNCLLFSGPIFKAKFPVEFIWPSLFIGVCVFASAPTIRRAWAQNLISFIFIPLIMVCVSVMYLTGEFVTTNVQAQKDFAQMTLPILKELGAVGVYYSMMLVPMIFVGLFARWLFQAMFAPKRRKK